MEFLQAVPHEEPFPVCNNLAYPVEGLLSFALCTLIAVISQAGIKGPQANLLQARY